MGPLALDETTDSSEFLVFVALSVVLRVALTIALRAALIGVVLVVAIVILVLVVAVRDRVRGRTILPVATILHGDVSHRPGNGARADMNERSTVRARAIPVPIIDEVPVAAVSVDVVVVVPYVVHTALGDDDEIRLLVEDQSPAAVRITDLDMDADARAGLGRRSGRKERDHGERGKAKRRSFHDEYLHALDSWQPDPRLHRFY